MGVLKRLQPALYHEILFYENVKNYYTKRTGLVLSYSNPQNISEKLFWIARYWKNPLIVRCADKFMVREYIKECGCEELLVPLYGVYNNAENINFDDLPSKFVLKCNHGCGYNILCKNKNDIDITNTKYILNQWLSEKYGISDFENHYMEIEPKIICEEYLNFAEEKSIIDYKIHCINGEPQFFLICSERDSLNHMVTLTTYSLKWEKLSYLKNEGKKEIPIPKCLDEMIRYARILSQPFPYVRVDFFYADNRIYFGELTFTPAGNIMNYYKEEILDMMGKKLVLPRKKKWK